MNKLYDCALLQISMSVLPTMETVVKFAPTPLEVTHVRVTVATH